MRRLSRSNIAFGLVVVQSLVSSRSPVPSAVGPDAAEAAEGGLVASRAWGWSEGKFSVSGDGAVEYSLPLWTPKGRGELQPQLGLSYRGGNGLLGVGWSLTGVSSRITPCPRTVAQDEVREAVRYDASDVYCLDGNRLRPTSTGTPSQRQYRAGAFGTGRLG